jgi:hypothetical protein
MAHNEGVIKCLCRYFENHELIENIIIELTLEIIANFFEFGDQLEDAYFRALTQNEIGNSLLPHLCSFLSDSPNCLDIQDSFMYCLSMCLWYMKRDRTHI